jgi:WD40 repeat protein
MQPEINSATGNQPPLPPEKKKISKLVLITIIAVVVMLGIGIVNLLIPGGRNLAPLVGSAEPTVTPNAPPITPVANATPVPTPVNTLLATLPDAIVDNLDNWSKTQSRGVNLALDNTNPDRFEGDTGRIKRLTASSEEIIWRQDGMKFFEATAYFWPGEEVSHFDMLVSGDGSKWQLAKPVIAGGTGDWKKFTYTLNNLAGVNLVMLRWNNKSGSSWSPQVAGVIYSTFAPSVANVPATTPVANAAPTTAIVSGLLAPIATFQPTVTPSTLAASPTVAPATATPVPATPTATSALIPSARFNLIEHNSPVNVVSWTKDGRHFATAAEDRTIKIWEATTNKVILTLDNKLRQPADRVLSLAWSSDNEYLVVASADKVVRVYRIFPKLGQPPGTLWFEASDGLASQAAALSADDSLLPYPGVGVLSTWDLKKNNYGPRFPLIGELTALVFSPDNRLMAMGLGDGRVQIWDINTITLVQTLDASLSRPNPCTRLAWSPDGRQLVVGRQKSFEVWQTASNGLLTTNTALTQPVKSAVTSLAISQNSDRLAVGSENGTVQLWSLADNRSSQEVAGNGSPVVGLNWRADGAQLTVANGGSQPSLTRIVPDLRANP